MNSKENSRKIIIIANEAMEVAQELYNETKAKNPLPYRELNDNCNLFDIVGRNAPELQDVVLRLMIRGNDLNGILDYVYAVSLL